MSMCWKLGGQCTREHECGTGIGVCECVYVGG